MRLSLNTKSETAFKILNNPSKTPGYDKHPHESHEAWTTLMRFWFIWKRIIFDAFSPRDHTATIENGGLRFRKRRHLKTLLNPETFENVTIRFSVVARKLSFSKTLSSDDALLSAWVTKKNQLVFTAQISQLGSTFLGNFNTEQGLTESCRKPLTTRL